MKELGKVLRERREQLGISLDDLQTQTKIRKRYLIALEDGEWDLLPGSVYARGFVKSYADAVGLDGQQLLAEHVPGSSGQDDEQRPNSSAAAGSPDGAPVSRSRPEPKKAAEPVQRRATAYEKAPAPRRSKPKQAAYTGSSLSGRNGRKPRNYVGEAVAVVAILAVIGGAWWMLRGGGDASANNVAAGNPGTNNTETTTPPSTNTENTDNAGGGPANEPADNAVDNSTAPATQPVLNIVSKTYKNGQQTYVVSTSDPLTLQLTAGNASCWIEVIADGKTVVPTDTLKASASRTWTANHEIRIKMGNTPAVSATLNGEPLTMPKAQVGWLVISKGTAD